jgi:hypothetical protein
MYWPNPAFRLKMIVILLAGLNAAVFSVFAHRLAASASAQESPGTLARVTGAMSLGLWLIVILLGRLLPTFEGSTSFF